MSNTFNRFSNILFTYSCNAMQLELCERIKQAQNNCTFSAACSPNQVFLPPGLHSSVIHWAHSSSSWGKKNICDLAAVLMANLV